ncbi:MAG: hypothetical protein AAFZ58_12050 [Pseudomonadota bacterium]
MHETADSTQLEVATNASLIRPVGQRLVLQQALGLPYLVSASLGALLALSTDAAALELGDARVTSALGQQLVVEIPYRTHHYERLTPACVGLVGAARGQLPAYTQVSSVSTRNNTITIRGLQRVSEPLVGLNLRIDCSSAPHIVRSYELFVDPRGVQATLAPATPAVRAEPRQPTAAPARRDAPRPGPRARGRSGAALVPGQSYVVQRGDTLSGIAARIAPRSVDLWTAVDAVYGANPGAFERGDINRLRAGATLVIPQFDATPALASSEAPPPSVTAIEVPQATAAATAGNDSALTELATDLAVADSTQDVAPAPAAEPVAVAEPQSPFVDSPISAPVADDSAPEILEYDAGSATGVSSDRRATSSAWLWGIIGIGAIAVLLFMWGARTRRRPQDNDDIDAFDSLPERDLDVPTARLRQLAEVPQPETALNALVVDSDEFDTSHTYGASTTFGDTAEEEFVPAGLNTHSLLDHTTPPADDPLAQSSVDLDIGEALAATGFDVGEATDIHATDDTSSTLTQGGIDPSMTIAEMDALTQDYEAEFTATHQLNAELAEAVADLKRTQAEQSGSHVVPDDETLITGTHGRGDDTEEFDAEATAFLEDAEVGPELSWDARTHEVAQQLTDEVLSDPAVLGDTVEQPRSMHEDEIGDTVEMPPRAADESGAWETTEDAANSDNDDDDWPAYNDAARRKKTAR